MSAASSEWELMLAAEGIEQGDTVKVELESGETVSMVYLSVERGRVKLRDSGGTTRRFSASSLEEVDGEATIAGKSDEEMSL